MNDAENIPQSEAQAELDRAEPSTLAVPGPSAAPAPEAHTYPPAFLESELPPSPEQLAAQTRVSQIPPDLRVPWGWVDLGIFLLFYVGSIVFFGIIATLVAASVQHVDLATLQKSPTVLYILLLIGAQGVDSIFVMFFLAVLFKVLHAGAFWFALGWSSLDGTRTPGAKVLRYLFGGVVLAIAVSLVSFFVKQPGPVPFEALFKARQTILMTMAFGILLAPIIEETMFRAFLYPVAARQFGIAPGILITGILFGGLHAQQLWGAWAQIGILMGVGVVLTRVRARSGSVLAGFLMHVAYNSTIFVGLLVQTHGLRDLP
jgi:membrane protease YdiL (CAAX protease family)